MKITAARLFSAVRRRLIDDPRGWGRPVADITEMIREVVVRNDAGAIWDIKLLRPRNASMVSA
jgi:hypothetical protein